MRKRIALVAAFAALAALAVALGSGSAGATRGPAASARALGGQSSGGASHSSGAPAACSPCLYYSGDFDPNDANANGLANEVDAIVTTGSSQYAPVKPDKPWQVTGLFTNNLSGLTPTSANWEIRTGVSEGNGGTVVASGNASVTQTATGRSAFGYAEYTDSVTFSAVTLNAGTTYWISVTPVCNACAERSFESNVPPPGANRVGPADVLDLSYWNSAFFGENFTNSNNGGVFHLFSFGVVGTSNPTIKVTKHLISYSGDPAKFNLRIDGVTYAANVGDGGSTGAITVTTGTHTVSETAGTGANLSNYTPRITCSDGSAAYGSSMQVTVTTGEQLTCTITNTRKLFKA